jgi:hypothetical protein
MPAKGFTSVTMHVENYEKIKRIAESKGNTVSQLIEYLIDQYADPSKRAFIDEPTSGGFTKVEWAWPGPYQDIVSDPAVQCYLSTAWIRSKEYVKTAASPQWAIDKRIREDRQFRAEKMFIMSEKAWEADDVWNWIANWFVYCFLGQERFKLLIVKEREARAKRIEERYFDMGIYGDPPKAIGYLTLDENSSPQLYTWISPHDTSEKEKALARFEILKSCAKSVKQFGDFEKLRMQDYNK